ncbi:MAG: serine/threonine protein kinase, partial [Planctomycetes bacterium]|nr:serine/threonine protein kinase [Planctomycetota bacterium]
MDDRLEIDNIIRVVRELRRNDTPVDDREIERQHAHLMPKLGEKLRLLSRLEDLPDHAETSARFGNCGLGELPDSFQQDMEFLRESLHGYDFTSRIHDGGQGTVYKAVHRATNRLVAVKLLLDGPLASQQQRKRFVREIEIVSRLRHPNIVTVYDCGEIRGRLYFTMEYVDGLPIDDYAYANHLGAEAIVRLFINVCQPLSYAHQRGVIHRDLKPSNILVDDSGQPRILDFGMAKDAETQRPSSLITIAGQVCGTL